MMKFEEIVKAISHALHLSKPVLMELTLFAIFLVEVFRFLIEALEK